MTRKLPIFIAILGLGFFIGCGGGSSSGGLTDPPNPFPPDSVSGTVTFNGAPLPGAQVTAFMTNVNSVYQVTTTDANGNYTFSGMQTTGNVPGGYQFWVIKNGYGLYPSVGSGAKVTRFDYTGQYPGNNVNDIPIYYTVIDYLSLPNASLTGANFAAYNGSNPLVSLAATGQQTAYVPGDDASLHKGVSWSAASRFNDNQDGTATDSLTGLIWLKNVGCFSPEVWANALVDVNQLATGSCGLSDGSKAGQWRLPNLNELESIVDVSASGPALSANNPFQNVSQGIYWSSTSYFGGETGSPKAWTIRLSDGRYMNDTVSNVKVTAQNAVWAVRGVANGTVNLQATGMYVPYVAGDDGTLQTGVHLTYPRWVDNGNGSLTDTVTGLVWLKQADCINAQWASAIAAVSSLATGQCGLTDGSTPGQWRMPNRNEMQSLSDRMETNHAAFFNHTFLSSNATLNQAAIFTNFVESQFYWTSTTNAANTNEAWTVFSCDFGVYDILKTNPGYTLAVR